jgi:hypothetical protein
MIALNVKSNIKEFTRYLTGIQKKQVPFATARALTWTAKDAQKHLQDAMPTTFNTSRKWWLAKQPTGIKIKTATKLHLVAEIYTTAYFLQLHEEGGIKIPYESRGILIPTALTPKYGRKSGGATKVLAGKKILRRGGRSTGSPITRAKSGMRGVFRRKGKKRLPVELLYSYVPTAKIKPRLHFKSRAGQKAALTFNANFKRSLSLALKTAR